MSADDSVQTPSDLKRPSNQLVLVTVPVSLTWPFICRLFEEKMTPMFEQRGEKFNVYIVDTAACSDFMTCRAISYETSKSSGSTMGQDSA